MASAVPSLTCVVEMRKPSIVAVSVAADPDIRQGVPLAGARPRGLHGDDAGDVAPAAPAHHFVHGRSAGVLFMAMLEPRHCCFCLSSRFEHEAALSWVACLLCFSLAFD